MASGTAKFKANLAGYVELMNSQKVQDLLYEAIEPVVDDLNEQADEPYSYVLNDWTGTFGVKAYAINTDGVHAWRSELQHDRLSGAIGSMRVK